MAVTAKKLQPKVSKQTKRVKPQVSRIAEKKAVGSLLSVSVLGADGKDSGRVELPEIWFGVDKPSLKLIAQAVRVYLANQRVGQAATKTRGQVAGSTRKIYRQKGTGRARHGGIRAPIFVGGGITFGPQPRDYSLQFPQKMRVRALAHTLSQQLRTGNVLVVDGWDGLAAKTKLMMQSLQTIGVQRGLVVVPKDWVGVKRSMRNIAGIDVVDAQSLTGYVAAMHQKIIFAKPAINLIHK